MIARALAVTAVSALIAGCGGGGNATPAALATGGTVPTAIRLAGVGDSLTAGMQSSGLLGTAAVNTVPGSPLGPAVPPTQSNGFWALLWSQANGGATTLNPATSPLPLIAAPGIANLLVPAANGAPTALSAPCASTLGLAFSAATAAQTRLAPQTTPFDVAIPGQTVHEALFQIAPQTPCQVTTVAGGAANPYYALYTLVSAESGTFLPILGTFGTNVTQVQAAAALRPQIVTVWLGSNDLLKFALSNGALAPTDAGALGSDLTAIVTTLQDAGAKVALANLLDVLGASYFTSQAGLTQIVVAQLTGQGVPLATAQGVAAQYVAQVQAQGVGPNGYLQLSGLLKTLGAVAAQRPVTLAASDTIPDALAAQVQGLNDAYNAQIAAVSASTGAPLVDVNTVFKQIRAAGGVPVNLPKCCSLLYGGGLASVDGIHPSNTGYAIIANTFIGTIDRAFGQAIPQVNVATIYASDPFAPR
jgi:lysophospholipase L1-like esterase